MKNTYSKLADLVKQKGSLVNRVRRLLLLMGWGIDQLNPSAPGGRLCPVKMGIQFPICVKTMAFGQLVNFSALGNEAGIDAKTVKTVLLRHGFGRFTFWFEQ